MEIIKRLGSVQTDNNDRYAAFSFAMFPYFGTLIKGNWIPVVSRSVELINQLSLNNLILQY